MLPFAKPFNRVNSFSDDRAGKRRRLMIVKSSCYSHCSNCSTAIVVVAHSNCRPQFVIQVPLTNENADSSGESRSEPQAESAIAVKLL